MRFVAATFHQSADDFYTQLGYDLTADTTNPQFTVEAAFSWVYTDIFEGIRNNRPKNPTRVWITGTPKSSDFQVVPFTQVNAQETWGRLAARLRFIFNTYRKKSGATDAEIDVHEADENNANAKYPERFFYSFYRQREIPADDSYEVAVAGVRLFDGSSEPGVWAEPVWLARPQAERVPLLMENTFHGVLNGADVSVLSAEREKFPDLDFHELGLIGVADDVSAFKPLLRMVATYLHFKRGPYSLGPKKGMLYFYCKPDKLNSYVGLGGVEVEVSDELRRATGFGDWRLLRYETERFWDDYHTYGTATRRNVRLR